MWACPHGSRTTRSDRSRIDLSYLSAYRPHDRGRIRANSTYLYVGMSLVAVARRGREVESESTRLTFMSALPHANARRGYGGGKRLGLRWCGMSENQQQLGGRSISCGVSLSGELISLTHLISATHHHAALDPTELGLREVA